MLFRSIGLSCALALTSVHAAAGMPDWLKPDTEITDCQPVKIKRLQRDGSYQEWHLPYRAPRKGEAEWQLCKVFFYPRMFHREDVCDTWMIGSRIWDPPISNRNAEVTYYRVRLGGWSCPPTKKHPPRDDAFNSVMEFSAPFVPHMDGGTLVLNDR